jgi:hypothetical protein
MFSHPPMADSASIRQLVKIRHYAKLKTVTPSS